MVLQAHMERKDIVRAAMRSAANLIRLRSVVSETHGLRRRFGRVARLPQKTLMNARFSQRGVSVRAAPPTGQRHSRGFAGSGS